MEENDLHRLKMYELYLENTIETNKEKAKKYSSLETDKLVENQIILDVKNKLNIYFPELKDYKI